MVVGGGVCSRDCIKKQLHCVEGMLGEMVPVVTKLREYDVWLESTSGRHLRIYEAQAQAYLHQGEYGAIASWAPGAPSGLMITQVA